VTVDTALLCPPRVHRRRAVVLNADIASYSRLLADDEIATVAAVGEYQRVADDAVRAARGTIINFVGDSFTAVFDDAHAAMRAAIAVCRAVKRYNQSRPRTRHMYFRMGLDAGEVVVADDGRYYGEPLNVAARVQAIAEVGGINVTETVYHELDEPALRLISMGRRRLKNIPEVVRVYCLAGVANHDDHDRNWPAGPTPASIAVLPTVPAGDTATREVASALRMDLLSALTRNPGLRVIDVQAGEAAVHEGPGTDLGAAYVLTVGVTRAGAELRAYTDLYETATLNRVWTRRWDGTTDDVFGLQDAVSVGTLHAIEIELLVGEPARIYRPVLDERSIAHVYRGWYHMAVGTRASSRRAVDQFIAITQSHPESPIGFALAAFALWWAVGQNLSDDPVGDGARAETLARQGMALDDDTGLSHMIVAALQLHVGGNLDAAVAEARHALQRRPTCDVTFVVDASVQLYLGAWEAAVQACRRALDLVSTPQVWHLTVLATAYYVGQRYEDAVETAERLLEPAPNTLDTLLVLAAAQQALGLRRRARATVALIVDRFPDARRHDLTSRHPYRDPEVLQRWTTHLAGAGLP
jgi:class 3 adenylate cyclase/TolB-like protein/tetratricopeptide (TPR) repeat protein